MTEQALERNFVQWLKGYKVVGIKGPAQTAKGFPDRFFQLPRGGGTVYVEFKGTSYYTLTPIQVWWKNYLLDSSPHRYFVVENEVELEHLKKMCIAFMEIGAKLVVYEQQLLEEVL